MDFLTVKGESIYAGERNVQLRGVNYGNWMLIESYMIGLNWVEYKIRQEFKKVLGEGAYKSFFESYMEYYVDEKDFKFLKSCGFNLIRVPFSYHHCENDMRPGEYLEDGFRYMDRIIALCSKYEMYMLPVIYSVPGSQARDPNAESAYGEVHFWDMKQNQDRIVKLWRVIAERYRDESTVMGYEVLEEPVTDKLHVLNNFYKKCIESIREVDSNHIIVVQNNLWGRDVSSLWDELFEDPQVIPTFHHYHQVYSPFKNMMQYPGEYEGKYYGKEELLACMKGHYDQERIKRPVLVGEFGMGFHLYNNDALVDMLDDIIGFFEEKKFHWTLWDYKDIDVMGLVYPKETTPWVEFLHQEDIKEFRNKCHEAISDFCKTMESIIGDKEVDSGYVDYFPHHVDRIFQPLALSYVTNKLKQYSPEELGTMARSFHFDNCVVRTQIVELLKKYTLK